MFSDFFLKECNYFNLLHTLDIVLMCDNVSRETLISLLLFLMWKHNILKNDF